ncbi:uncharacterized protein LOC115885740 [Sitophilus oryzae]|uniref:Uncharacterized protein LOC115885740 n=1 Tax=Sitophilus oryzae TaxID=7048 RepID=A0A6J2YAV4_SITOR|nr:uncharacterized protein LOC115885740 [Sitophilus oryzae]
MIGKLSNISCWSIFNSNFIGWKMAEDKAKSDFSDIMKNLNSKFDITDCKWSQNKSFEIKLRTQIRVESEDYNSHCDEWVEKFSRVTNTVWVHKISNTGPKVKFRKQYQCWTYDKMPVKNELLFDARKCRATLDVKFFGDNTYSKKKNKFTRLGLNALIRINSQHLHPVDTVKDFAFFVHHCKPLSEAPKQVIPSSNDKLPQLVAKMVKQAAATSQKAAERAEETLKKQRIDTMDQQPSEQPCDTAQVSQNVQYEQLPQEINTLDPKYEIRNSLPQVIINQPPVQHNDNRVYYVQQLLYDSTTQTIIEEVIPVSDPNISNVSGQHIIQMQMPQVVNIPQVYNVNQQL